ncbi:hypothetical protein CTI12_AA098470 [Artemisia annua]|uniref:MAT1 centre domain-containing protein n=1 Tax=Artemisia annua TaxID=35608 RepID=A0A2U1PY08_ARTAN|nr:hypothetical protein CTI12_AA098470 [Artemisia annua]
MDSKFAKGISDCIEHWMHCIKRFNKRVEDFSSLREYNDYLEDVEDMIVDLVDGNNVPAHEAKIARYQKENAEQIMNAQARKAEEYAAALAASKGQLAQTDVDMWINALYHSLEFQHETIDHVPDLNTAVVNQVSLTGLRNAALKNADNFAVLASL